MTATDELRRMLDERGAKYEVDDAETVMVTRWEAYGDWVSFIEYDNGETKFYIDARRMTPEQAIAATVGRGPCHVTKRTAGYFDGTRYNEWTFEFSCGHWYRGGNPVPPSFCCHCGRRIEVCE